MDDDVIELKTPLISLLGKRKRTGMQKRAAKWLEYHPGVVCYGVPIKTDTEVNGIEDDIVFGTFRVPPEFFYGKDPGDVGVFWEADMKKWAMAYIEACGFVYEVEFTDDINYMIQAAVLACTGMTDSELAKFLKVREATVKSWYSKDSTKKMTDKVITAIAGTFVTDDDIVI